MPKYALSDYKEVYNRLLKYYDIVIKNSEESLTEYKRKNSDFYKPIVRDFELRIKEAEAMIKYMKEMLDDAKERRKRDTRTKSLLKKINSVECRGTTV